ncbi:copper chaperone PCu(A)C [Campylobacter sp. RM15925]|uniref:copper chaperone PCu(A)C n=1 Tax=Campylobacter sp. RM15925 TaxID=1705724 RepID=UPI001473ACBD|nr:copper chaperone PCu(A)C [Campylobacter sp. RM15925]
MKKMALFCALTLAFCVANAADIEVSNAFAKATPPHVKNSAAFMDIKNNTDKNIKLIAASSNISKTAELHTHKHAEGMMQMIQVDDIEIPAKSEVSLKPGGLHVMFMNIFAPVKDGDKIDITLEFDNGSKVELKDVIAKPVMKKENMSKH